MKIDSKTVQHYAALAQLEFDEQETALLANQLGSILDYVDQIKTLDLADTEPLFFTGSLQAPLREDAIKPSLGRKVALGNAPDTESDHFLVPKVINVKS